MNSRRIVAVGVGVVLSLVWFKFLPVPFLGPAVLLVLLALAGVRRTRNDWIQTGLIVVASVMLTLGGAETYFWVRANRNRPASLDYPRSYLQRDSVLGYALVPGSRTRLRRVWHDTLVYDVVYTIDSLGLRVSPRPEGTRPEGCALFFGDSYVIGEGVADSATMPYRTAMRTGGRYQVYNFGVHGYGPHQMLALLETGRVASRIDCVPRFAIYEAIPAQVLRAAGREQVRGPRYRLGTDESLRRDGVFQLTGQMPPWREYLRDQLTKSALVRMLTARVRESDRRLFVHIVKASAQRVERDYPGAEFHVILWAASGTPNQWMLDRLRAEGLRVHLIDDILPVHRTSPGSLRIPHDGHPTAEAQDAIAAYVAERILR